jgi:hypothetical protein
MLMAGSTTRLQADSSKGCMGTFIAAWLTNQRAPWLLKGVDGQA